MQIFQQENFRAVYELLRDTFIDPISVPQKIMSLAVSKLVILLPADNLPTFCFVSLSQIWFYRDYAQILTQGATN